MSETNRRPAITKVVITGGPCAGKSTALSWINNAFTSKGYKVLVVPETATEFITGGVAPWTCGTNEDYQKCQMTLQLEKERLFEYAASTMDAERILIVCDRGAMDNKAYMTEEEFAHVLQTVGRDEITLRDSYDAVFHLVTAAKGAEQFYTKENNAARYETVEEARALDDKLLASWNGHPHLRIIDNKTDFSAKMHRLISEMTALLGEPEPYEAERKYLIAYPDLKTLEKLPSCRKVEISQVYLKAAPGEVIRLRQRGINGHYTYYVTTRRPAGEGKRIELERLISQSEYLRLMMDADLSYHPIRKTRYCITHACHVFNVDIYPFWQDQALMETELYDMDEAVEFPPMIEVLKEVTMDPQYKNHALARL